MKPSPARRDGMRIYVQTQGFELTAAIDEHVRKQLTQNFRAMENQIIAVDVFLGDINGPRGGEDKKALLSVQLVSRLAVRFEAVHADLYAAVSVAARRAKHTVKRTLRRHNRIKKAELRQLRLLQGELQPG
jgi:putative sigma-54 modulation protein